MLWYILKLIVLLPAIGLLAWACLRFAHKMQARVGAGTGGRAVRVIETTMLSPTQKLAVLEFHGREILVSVSRQGISRLAEAPGRETLP